MNLRILFIGVILLCSGLTNAAVAQDALDQKKEVFKQYSKSLRDSLVESITSAVRSYELCGIIYLDIDIASDGSLLGAGLDRYKNTIIDEVPAQAIIEAVKSIFPYSPLPNNMKEASFHVGVILGACADRKNSSRRRKSGVW
jgi:hypothetical protein